MKLNIDCVRDLLLAVENYVNFDENLIYPTVSVEKLFQCDFLRRYSKADIFYTALKLYEGGFINADVQYGDNTSVILIKSLTYEGHCFLENIRTPAVWSKTKSKAAKIGSFALDVISEIAVGYVLKHIT